MELDLEARPGSHSPGYVSNVEGVLNRFQDVIDMVGREAAIEGNDTAISDLAELTQAMIEIREGRRQATLEFLDPLVHSMILAENVQSRELTVAEIEDLPVGPAAGLMEAGASMSRTGAGTE